MATRKRWKPSKALVLCSRRTSGSLSPELLEPLKDFTMAREKKTGGFGATPRLPATVEDTYYALRISHLLGFEVDQETHLRYLWDQPYGHIGLASVLFKAAWSLKTLGGTIPETLWQGLPSASPEMPLSELSYLARLTRLLEISRGPTSGLKRLALDKEVRTIRDLYFLLQVIGPGEKLRPLLDWVLAAQNPDGGFGFFPGTTSYLENAYFACFILKAFGLSPRQPDALGAFALSCRRKDGGFARAPGGVSFLETSWYALCILRGLNFII
ncbi:hypothetical protein HNQ76_002007 [Thermosulfuriphilus ammonigenes]|nr:hypothetical protein [Thermosulfuriphilus ammonigenes]